MFALLAETDVVPSLLAKLSREQTMAIIVMTLIFCTGALIAVSATVAHYWQKARTSELRRRMVAQMVERGMSGDEITRVLLAADISAEDAAESAAASKAASPKSPEPAPEVTLVKVLSDNSYDGDDIQRILAAAQIRGQVDAVAVGMVRELAGNWVDADNIVAVLESHRARAEKADQPSDAPRPV